MKGNRVLAGALAGLLVGLLADGVSFGLMTAGGPAAWVLLQEYIGLLLIAYLVLLVICILAGVGGSVILTKIIRARNIKQYPENVPPHEPGVETAALGGALGSIVIMLSILLLAFAFSASSSPSLRGDHRGSFTPYPPASNPPKIATRDEAQSAAAGGGLYSNDFRNIEAGWGANGGAPLTFFPDTVRWPAHFHSSDRILWIYSWCAGTPDLLASNLKSIQLKFSLDGKVVPLDSLVTYDDSPYVTIDGKKVTYVVCHYVFTILSQWPVGSHDLSITSTFTNKVSLSSTEVNAQHDYPAGDYVVDYTVNIDP